MGRVQVLRAAELVRDLVLADVEAEVVEESGYQVAVLDGTLVGSGAVLRGGADHLPGAHAAAGQEAGGDLRPVVAAGIFVDARRASEVAPDDHREVPVEAAVVDVLDESA